MPESIYLLRDLVPKNLPEVTLAGTVSVSAPNVHFKRIPKEWILYIVTEGHMVLKEDELIYHLSAGDTILLSPGRCHVGIKSDNPVAYHYIHFLWEDFHETILTEKSYFGHLQKEQKNRPDFLQDDRDMQTLILPKHTTLLPAFFAKILAAVDKLLAETESLLPYQSCVKNSVLYLCLIAIARSSIEKTLSKTSSASFIPELLFYLRHHIDRKINSALLEETFHMNFDYMNRRFKESTGKNIFQYLQEYRIQESKKLLQTGHFRISEIAEQLGYCNAFYFSKTFKKAEHMTPSEYRKKHLLS